MSAGRPSVTAGELRAALVGLPDDTPVIAYDHGADWFLNIDPVAPITPPGADDVAAVLNTADSFDTRQW